MRFAPVETSQAEVQNSSLRVPTYDRTKPLAQEHYEARLRARQESQALTNTLTERAQYQEMHKKMIGVLYWKTDACLSDFFEVPCVMLPLFSLKDCTEALRQALGIQNSATLIQTFNPVEDRWVTHTMDTVRSITGGQKLFYRTCGVTFGEDMETTINEARVPKAGRSRKRPIDIDIEADCERPTQKLRLCSPQPGPSTPPAKRTAAFHHLQREIQRPSPQTPTRGLPHTTTPAPLMDSSPVFGTPDIHHRQDSATPPLAGDAFADIFSDLSSARGVSRNVAAPVAKRALEPSTVSKLLPTLSGCDVSSIKSPSARIDGGSQMPTEAELDKLPLSNHGPIPLKYVKSMVKGFDRIDNMSGNLGVRVGIAFPTTKKLPNWPKTSYHKASKLWKNAPPSLRNKLLSAGYTEEGTWDKLTEAMKKATVPSKIDEAQSSAAATSLSENSAPTAGLTSASTTEKSRHKGHPTTTSQCGYCKKPWPPHPSVELLELQSQLHQLEYSRMDQKVLELERQHCRKHVSELQRHKMELLRLEQPEDLRWSAVVDFATLPSRIDALRVELYRIAEYPFVNSFFIPLLNQMTSLGTDKAFGIQGDYASDPRCFG